MYNLAMEQQRLQSIKQNLREIALWKIAIGDIDNGLLPLYNSIKPITTKEIEEINHLWSHAEELYLWMYEQALKENSEAKIAQIDDYLQNQGIILKR